MASGDAQPLDLNTRLALRPAEAARALGVGERTLRQILPELPHVRVGTTVLLPVDALRKWLSEKAEAQPRQVEEIVAEVLDSIGGRHS